MIKRLDVLENVKNTQTSGRLASLLGNCSKITINPVILDITKGYRIPLLDLEYFEVSLPPSISMTREETIIRPRN